MGNGWEDEGMNRGRSRRVGGWGSIDGERGERGRNKEMDTKRNGGMERWVDEWKEGRVEGLVERGVGWAGSPYPTVFQGSQRGVGVFICPVSPPRSPAKGVQ